MFELTYPQEPAPVLPPFSIDTRDMKASEYFPVIEPSGMVVARASREYCHGGAKPLHPVVHLHVIDRYGKLYLQKRSAHKDIQPGKWDTSVGGHVDYGETIEAALMREAREELGLSVENPILLFSYVFQSDIEKELVNTFLVKCIGEPAFRYDSEEIDDGRFWAQDDIEKNIGKGIFTPNFEREYIKLRQFLVD